MDAHVIVFWGGLAFCLSAAIFLGRVSGSKKDQGTQSVTRSCCA